MTTSPKAILFGAIGTLADTTEMQRDSFNSAFRDAGLDWEWDRGDYRRLLEQPGGEARIAAYAASRGETVDAEAIHKLKVRHFELRAKDGLTPRPGVPEVIARAIDKGVTLGFVTSTGRATVDLMREGLRGQIDFNDFAFVGQRDMVEHGKPAPDIYRRALQDLALAPADAIAIEDTPESAQAALAAQVPCIGFPGDAARDRNFPAGVPVRDMLTLPVLGLGRDRIDAA